MGFVRMAWVVLALLGVGAAFWSTRATYGDTTDCDKGRFPGDRCDESVVDVIGIWPPVQLGLALALPPVIAAVILRGWLSWLCVAWYLIPIGIGVTHWPTYRIEFGAYGFLFLFLTLLMTLVQYTMRARVLRRARQAKLAATTPG